MPILLFQGLLLPPNASPTVPGTPPGPPGRKGRGSFCPKCVSHLCTLISAAIRQMKAPNCVFCLASLHLISMLSPVLLNSSLRAFFLFSLCQLLLFDLQKQMRHPGESPRPSGMTEFSSAPQTPCHSPTGPPWQGEPVQPLPELGQGQGTAGHCSPVPTWALCPPTWAPEYTPECVTALLSSLPEPSVMGEFVSQSHLGFPWAQWGATPEPHFRVHVRTGKNFMAF